MVEVTKSGGIKLNKFEKTGTQSSLIFLLLIK